MPPGWFKKHIQTPATQQCVTHAGVEIAYRRWRYQPQEQAPGQPGQAAPKPGLLLVHGQAAQSHWWDFIAPGLMNDYELVALDLSGHGDSGHRAEYSATIWAGEIATVCEAAELYRPTLVGHSLGGSMARVAAYLYPDLWHSILLVDSVLPSSPGWRNPPPLTELRPRLYPTLAQGMARFRLRPAQPPPADYILRHIAAHSLRRGAGQATAPTSGATSGYRFKLDRAMLARMLPQPTLPVATEMLQALRVPVGFIYGKKSRFFPPEQQHALSSLIASDLLCGIEAAHHHVFLDQPLTFIATLRQLLHRLGHE